MSHITRRLLVVLALGWARASHACPHDGAATGPVPKHLGSVSFPNSCGPAVQADFEQGIALLHSFWLVEAQRAFERVAAADPQCGIAYWGQAMSLVPWLNVFPDVATAAAAQRALTTADTAAKHSPRELDYVKAMHAFFDGYTPATARLHTTRYADAMATLASRYPHDLEARVLHALSLVEAAPADDLELVNQKKAFAILAPLFKAHPNHPGIAHYITHACDNPQMAKLGLAAARRYASIAPASPHALHMPGHIFIRLGLWQEDIATNLASKAAAMATKVGAEARLHAMEFLEYAYLQSGEYDKARAIVAESKTIPEADVDPRFGGYAVSVKARYAMLAAVETQDWTAAATLNLPGMNTFGYALIALAHAEAAAHLHDARAGALARKIIDTLYAGAPEDQVDNESKHVRDEVRAWASFASGDVNGAVQLLRPIAEMQAKFGKEEVELPAREMVAEMLLLGGKPAEALAQYQTSLVSDPNRLNALLGAAQAAEQTGQRPLAEQYRHTASANCAHADRTGLVRLR